MLDTIEIKKTIIEIGKRLYNKGFTPGMSGNISYRWNDRIFITGTGVCLGEMSEAEIVLLDEEGNSVENYKRRESDFHPKNSFYGREENQTCSNIKQSSESMMHIKIYKKRPEINAIIHAHPPFSTTLSISGETNFPAILAEPVVMFGNMPELIPVVQYETPSTIALAKSVAKYFEQNNAVLMANHGATVCGHDLKEAFYKLETLEFYSQVYLYSGMLGKRTAISSEKIQELMSLKH